MIVGQIMGICDILEQLSVTPKHAEDCVFRSHVEETVFPADPWCARASWVESRDGAQVTGVEKAYGKTREAAMQELRAKLEARLHQHTGTATTE